MSEERPLKGKNPEPKQKGKRKKETQMKKLIIFVAALTLLPGVCFAEAQHGWEGPLSAGVGAVYMPMDETSQNSTVYDYSGGANDGTIINPMTPDRQAGVWGNAVDFDGDPDYDWNTYVDVPAELPGSIQKLTVQFWVNLDAVKQNGYAGHDMMWQGGHVYVRSQGDCTMYANFFDNGNRTAYGSTAIPTEEWVHIAATYDGSGETRYSAIFVNGVLDGWHKYTGADGMITVADDWNFVLGDNRYTYSWAAQREMQGLMDDFGIEYDSIAIPEPSILLAGLALLFARRKK